MADNIHVERWRQVDPWYGFKTFQALPGGGTPERSGSTERTSTSSGAQFVEEVNRFLIGDESSSGSHRSSGELKASDIGAAEVPAASSASSKASKTSRAAASATSACSASAPSASAISSGYREPAYREAEEGAQGTSRSHRTGRPPLVEELVMGSHVPGMPKGLTSKTCWSGELSDVVCKISKENYSYFLKIPKSWVHSCLISPFQVLLHFSSEGAIYVFQNFKSASLKAQPRKRASASPVYFTLRTMGAAWRTAADFVTWAIHLYSSIRECASRREGRFSGGSKSSLPRRIGMPGQSFMIFDCLFFLKL